jgi:hypothetical protein
VARTSPNSGSDGAPFSNQVYIGWRNKRVRGAEYEEFVDTFVTAVKRRWPHVLLQWEDFAGVNAAKLLERYRNQLCTFNDDIQGTAAVATATLLSAINVTGMPLTEQRIAFVGFGGALTRLAHRGRVNDGQRLLHIMRDQRIEKRLVCVLKIPHKTVFSPTTACAPSRRSTKRVKARVGFLLAQARITHG